MEHEKPTYRTLKQDIAALQKSKDLFHAIFEGSRNAIFITDDNKQFAYVNQAACVLTGYTKQDLLSIGIPDLHSPGDMKNFEKFFDSMLGGKTSISEKEKGTGMGLSVVHGIVTGMKGTIQVYSEPGKGTRFCVYLPLEKGPPAEEGIAPQVSIPMGSEHILLVDDDASIIDMEKMMLERLGYRIAHRTSSIEALEAFRTDPRKYDLVISDMTMPKMPGDKLAAELLRLRPNIPILLCTGFSQKMTEKKIQALGVRGLLMKPVLMMDLAQKIREVLS